MANQYFPLQLAASAQILPSFGASAGSHRLALVFNTAPSAGVVLLEYKLLGSPLWVVLQAAADVTAGYVVDNVDGPVELFRVTFSGLTGGAGPALWVSTLDTATPPLDLLTDKGDGPNRRYRVDVGQTGFFAGREFRVLREFSTIAGADAGVIPTGQSVLIRSVVPINAILMSLHWRADLGHGRVSTWRGGAPTIGGLAATFPNVMTAIPANVMTEVPAPAYSPQIVTAASNASATVVMAGSVRLDVERLKIATATGQATTAEAADDDQRGVNAATYYIWVQNIGSGDLEGVLKARYEERP